MMMVLMQESMKSSLTLNHGLTGISKQLINGLVGGSGPFAPAATSLAVATQHLGHQTLVVTLAMHRQPQMPHLERPHTKTWKSWDNCPDFFSWSS